VGDPRHIAYLLVPLAEVEIVDDWQVLGLAGTGSKSLVLHARTNPRKGSVRKSLNAAISRAGSGHFLPVRP
jgi:hypothetical protein